LLANHLSKPHEMPSRLKKITFSGLHRNEQDFMKKKRPRSIPKIDTFRVRISVFRKDS